ncbi:MAG: glycosyltransferase family 4 protein [Planctomycetales bacterium]|nr:glycosyltransferase family 4 protein [Planctomycetales bacterium]
MRFCLFSTQQHWGGGEALLKTVGDELQLSGHAVAWVARNHSEVHERIVGQSEQLLHATDGRGWNVADWLSVIRVFRQWAPDVLLLNDTHAVPLAGTAAWFCRRPKPLRLAYKHTIFPLRSKLKYQFLTDKIVCVSQAAFETLCQGGLGTNRLAMIYGGCSIPQVEPQTVATIRHEFNVAGSRRLIVCVGNLLKCKGHAELIQAAALLPGNKDLLIVIAGQGEQEQRLRHMIADLGLSQRVRLLGYRHDAEQLLAAADLVVHPSHAEGLSLVLIQAQMLGKPIVATAVGGAAEVLNADRPEDSSCWLAEPRQSADLARAISQALTELERPDEQWTAKLNATTQRTLETFSSRRTGQQLAELAASLRVQR